jgi:adenylate cyclase
MLDRAYHRLGPRYPRTALLVLLQVGYLVGLVAMAAMVVYFDMTFGQFLRMEVAELLLFVVDAVLAIRFALHRIEPVTAWLRGERDAAATIAAWRAAATLPLELLRYPGLYVAAGLLAVAWGLYAAWQLGLPVYSLAILFPGCALTYLYWVVLRFLGTERVLRPVLGEIGETLPDDAELPAVTVSLQWRLLAAMPAMIVITGSVLPGLSSGGSTELARFGIGVLAAGTVALTIAIPLIGLLSGSVVAPIAELEEATKRVEGGDLETRVSVFSTDETGELARSFNRMVAGLAERERIREALGIYVDREVAEHILREGTSLTGEQVEVTMMFLDIHDFTGFAERVAAPEVVATLNRLFERVVPVVHAHGGHIDKFVGDGFLAVFGAPRRLPDHADEALVAALEITDAVESEFDGGLSVGIGLNSGTVVAGNVGGAGRLEFSVIGDAVNVAARVESATRQTGDSILVSEHTRRLLRRGAVDLEERPHVPLKGKRKAIALSAPVASRVAKA